jgi:hypothetical protein
MSTVTTDSPHRTYLLPLFFTFVENLAAQRASGEVSRETKIFVSLLVVLALEIVLAAQTPGRKVLVICYLNCVVEDLRSFLRYALPSACARWHAALQLSDVATDRYSFDELTKDKILAVVGPFRCKGMTADVGILVCMKRQWKDAKYQGLATDAKLLGIHYTRSMRRLYAFVHDLTAEIDLPRGGKELNRGLKLGASRSSNSTFVGNSEARHQLFYLALKNSNSRVAA